MDGPALEDGGETANTVALNLLLGVSSSGSVTLGSGAALPGDTVLRS